VNFLLGIAHFDDSGALKKGDFSIANGLFFADLKGLTVVKLASNAKD